MEDVMNGYKAFYNRKEIEVYADTLYGAKLKAIQIFKPKKKDEHNIAVVLCEKNGEQVVHVPAD
jgi:hypothetical protein